MKIRKTHASWALRTWVLLSVLAIPFLEPLEVVGWLLLGALLALAWKALPEEPEAPVEKLPFHGQYADRAIPPRDAPPREGDPPPK